MSRHEFNRGDLELLFKEGWLRISNPRSMMPHCYFITEAGKAMFAKRWRRKIAP